MALQKRPGKPGQSIKPIDKKQPIEETTRPIKRPGKPIRPGDKINKPNDPIKKLPKVPGSGNPQLDQIRKQIEERNKKDGQYVDSLYNTYPM